MAILTCRRVDKVHLRRPHAVRGDGLCAARGPHSCSASSWSLGPGGVSASPALRAPRFLGCGIECSRSRHGAEQGRVTANADVAKRRAPSWWGPNAALLKQAGLAGTCGNKDMLLLLINIGGAPMLLCSSRLDFAQAGGRVRRVTCNRCCLPCCEHADRDLHLLEPRWSLHLRIYGATVESRSRVGNPRYMLEDLA